MSDMELPSAAQIAALPRDGGDTFNRLVFETSPYLLQHCQNPVDWRPWGPEAFAEARARDRPIFLSIGYSTCHWCHVMERESFERDDVAAVLNAHFVPVKVDREERPDLDEIYMAATQMLTGRGGWPMSVWLTPDAEPFFAGTYYPREDRVVGRHPVDGPVVQPGFITLLRRLSEFWMTQRDEALERARDLADAVRQHCEQAGGEGTPGLEGRLDTAVDELEAAFDPHHGGFVGTPKFPPHGALRLLLHLLERGDERGRAGLSRTLDAMAQGGVHDHVGGGFHRYSTDERWFLPHFEKMLYDNAQMGRAYVDGWRLLGDGRHRLVAERLYDWVLREMTDEAGGFTSALDADSEGEEGTFYVWKPQEIVSILGAEIGSSFCERYGVTQGGNWRDEASGEEMATSIPHLVSPMELDTWSLQIPALEALYERRVERIWPHHDDKVLTSWNGLMIASMAYAGAQLARPDYLAAAERAARFARDTLWVDGRLLATYRAGTARLSAYLDDHAFLADGLLELHAATGSDEWLAFAQDLVGVLLDRFGHPEGGFYFIADDHEDLLVRSRSGIDGATPSGNGVAARVLHRLGELTGEPRYGEAARKTVEAFSPLMNRYSRATESLLLASSLIGDEGGDWADSGVAREGPVSMSLVSDALSAPAGTTIDLTVEVTVDPGSHIQSSRPTEAHLIATELRISDSEVVRLDEVAYPDAHETRVGDTLLALFGGTFRISGRLHLSDSMRGTVSVELSLRHQACDDLACQRPAILRLPMSITAT